MLVTLQEGASRQKETVKEILTEAQEKGLDLKRIYQCAVNPKSTIIRRIPAWEDERPDQTHKPRAS